MAPEGPDAAQLAAFTQTVWEQGRTRYRDLPWRNTHDPYAILVSEVMLQQTQVARVQGRWERWLDLFPTPAALAAAPLPPVLEQWQGMGYNRRALNLKKAAETIVASHGGIVPGERDALLALPGIGPATAAGVRVFAFEQPDVYIETNVRAVFIHELFEGRDKVSDRELVPLVEQTCPPDDARAWYYALLDYGAWLKKAFPNPTRRSAQHTRQSAFEGSHRQKRAFLLRRVLEGAATTHALAADLAAAELKAGRAAPSDDEVAAILDELVEEGFVERIDTAWTCAE